jgi:hypothetical protein
MPRPIDQGLRLHYTIISGTRAKCNYCDYQIVFNATRARAHLTRCTKSPTNKEEIAESASLSKYVTKLTAPAIRDLQLRAAKWIFCDGRPLDTFDSKHTRQLFEALNPGFRPPSRYQLTGPLLTAVYEEYKVKVQERFSRTNNLNIIFDASENINGQRVLNICVNIHNDVSYYWKTLDTFSTEMTATNYLLLLQPILVEIAGTNFGRINSFSTDSCATMRALRRLVLQDSKLRHCFWILCDSHGLQLLIKDILNLPAFVGIVQQLNTLVTGFKISKLQNVRLREEQERLYKKRHTLITR